MAEDGKSIRLLYMEDDPTLARLIQVRLSREDFEVEFASDGEQGLAMYGAGTYDAIAVDHAMPGYSGLDVIRALVSQGCQCPIIMVTGSGDERVAVEAMKLGAKDYIIKDVNGAYLDLLPTVLNRVVREQRMLAGKLLAEVALSTSEARFRELFVAISSGVALFKRAGDGGDLVLDDINESGTQILGVERATLVGRPLPEVLRGEGLAKLMELSECVWQSGQPAVQPAAEFIGADGPVWLENRVCRLPSGEIAVVYNDLTARRQAEEQRHRLAERVQQVQKLESLQMLASGVAHDFNNILQAIVGYADLALDEMPADGPSRTDIERIKLSARRARELTEQMLEYSGHGFHESEPVGLLEVISQVVGKHHDQIPADTELVLDVPAELPAVNGDGAQLAQMLANLLTNAVEAIGGEPGQIRLRAGVTEADAESLDESVPGQNLPAGSYVWIEVEDTGCGMNGSTKSRIFEPFFSTRFVGRGLGLACVLGIVRGHGGAVSVDSEVGVGTTFRVLLPTARETPTADVTQPAPAEERQVEQGRHWRTVLVVDDEEAVRYVIDRMLSRAGYRVLEACDGEEAVEVFRERGHLIDLVILDLTMPRMDGLGAFREMRKIRPDLHVLLSSGYSAEDSMGHFSDAGSVDFIQKPYSVDALLDKVHAAIALG